MPNIIIPTGLDIRPENAFSQSDIIKMSEGKLSSKGVCNGLIMKRAIEHIDLDHPTPIKFFHKKILNKFDDFVETTNFYQYCLQTSQVTDAQESVIANGRIYDGSFIDNIPDSMKKSNVIGFGIVGAMGGHIISITLIRDENNNVFGYKIFDPNYGEINCSNGGNAGSNRDKFNQQLNRLCAVYQKEENEYRQDEGYESGLLEYSVSDVESVIRSSGLSKTRPLAADKTKEEIDGKHTIRPILSEYSYEEKNRLLKYHMERYGNTAEVVSLSQNDDSRLKDIDALIKSGANPNLLRDPLIDVYKHKFFAGGELSKILKQHIKSNNFDAIKDMIQFAGIENIRNAKVEYKFKNTITGVVDKGYSSVVWNAYQEIGSVLALKLLNAGMRISDDELKNKNEAKILQKLSMDVNAKLKNGKPIMGELIKGNNIESIDYLLKYFKVDVNAKDPQGNSLLHIAVQNGRTNIVRKLIAKNADVTLVNQNGKTALSYAESNQEIIDLLNNALKPKYSIFIPRLPSSSFKQEKVNDENIHPNLRAEDMSNSKKIGKEMNYQKLVPDDVKEGMSSVVESSSKRSISSVTILGESKKRKVRHDIG